MSDHATSISRINNSNSSNIKPDIRHLLDRQRSWARRVVKRTVAKEVSQSETSRLFQSLVDLYWDIESCEGFKYLESCPSQEYLELLPLVFCFIDAVLKDSKYISFKDCEIIKYCLSQLISFNLKFLELSASEQLEMNPIGIYLLNLIDIGHFLINWLLFSKSEDHEDFIDNLGLDSVDELIELRKQVKDLLRFLCRDSIMMIKNFTILSDELNLKLLGLFLSWLRIAVFDQGELHVSFPAEKILDMIAQQPEMIYSQVVVAFNTYDYLVEYYFPFMKLSDSKVIDCLSKLFITVYKYELNDKNDANDNRIYQIHLRIDSFLELATKQDFIYFRYFEALLRVIMIEKGSVIKDSENGKVLLCTYCFDCITKKWKKRDRKLTIEKLARETIMIDDLRGSIIEEKPIDYEISFFQCFYTPDVRKQAVHILNKILCVFASLSLVSFIDSIIILIAEDSEHVVLTECCLLFFYAVFAHAIGRYIYYHFVFNQHVYWVEKIHEWHADELFEEFAIEHSAFAWKEFSEKFIFSALYPFYENSMSVWVLLWAFMTLCVNYILHYFTYFRYHNKKRQKEMYQFDNRSFGLSIAFLLTVAWLNFFNVKGVGAEFKEVFFSWESHSRSYCHSESTNSNTNSTLIDSGHSGDDYLDTREVHHHTFGQYYRFMIYPFIVGLFITTYFFFEDIFINFLQNKRRKERISSLKRSSTAGSGAGGHPNDHSRVRNRSTSSYSLMNMSFFSTNTNATPVEFEARDNNSSQKSINYDAHKVRTISMQFHSFIRSAWKFFRIFLGYFSGLAWFEFILNCLDYFKDNTVGYIFGILIAIILSWRMAFLVVYVRQFTNYTLSQRAQVLHHQKSLIEEENDETMMRMNSRELDRSRFQALLKKYARNPFYAYSYYFFHLLFCQTQTTEESIPITIGFLWESILKSILIQSLSCAPDVNIAINFTSVIVIIIVILFVHVVFKDFEEEGEEFLEKLVKRKQELDAQKQARMSSMDPLGNHLSLDELGKYHPAAENDEEDDDGDVIDDDGIVLNEWPQEEEDPDDDDNDQDGQGPKDEEIPAKKALGRTIIL